MFINDSKVLYQISSIPFDLFPFISRFRSEYFAKFLNGVGLFRKRRLLKLSRVSDASPTCEKYVKIFALLVNNLNQTHHNQLILLIITIIIMHFYRTVYNLQWYQLIMLKIHLKKLVKFQRHQPELKPVRQTFECLDMKTYEGHSDCNLIHIYILTFLRFLVEFSQLSLDVYKKSFQSNLAINIEKFKAII